jgi:YHS domain-containing protein
MPAHDHEHETSPSARGRRSLGPRPIGGSPVLISQAEEAGFYRDYGGRRYWFCCAGCGSLFDADPEGYADGA